MYSIVNFISVFVKTFADIMSVLIIIRVVLSWLAATGKGRMGGLSQIVFDVTEPFLRLVRKLPHRVGMMDFSPIIALFALDLIEYLILIILKML